MLRTQKSVIDISNAMMSLVKDVEPPEAIMDKLRVLIADAKDRELVIPVVGAFSAGKSTLINQFCGDSKLPTAITPETSLATEIHYSPEEYIEAIRADGSVTRHDVNDMASIKEKAKEYSFIRLYTSSQKVKEAAPLVLVDMPGFDSPFDAHNKAIMAYLSRGSHYVVLSSVEDGTITRTLMRRLEEIDQYGRSFTFFLSKSDLRAPNVVDELVEHYQASIKDTMDLSVKVIPFGKQVSNALSDILANISPETQFLNIYRDSLKELCYDLIEAINTRILAAQIDTKTSKSAIQEMQRSLDSLHSKSDKMISEIEDRYSGVIVNDLVEIVGRDLNTSVNDLSSVGASGNSSELSQRLAEMVRHSLLMAMKDKMGNLNQRIVGEFSLELKGLDQLMKGMSGVDFSKSLGEKIQASFESVSKIGEFVGDLAKKEQTSKSVKNIYKVVVSTAAICTTVLAPVFELILFFLPDLLGMIFSGQSKQEQVKAKLLQEVFPDIKQKIRQELPATLQEQVGNMIKSARDQYLETIKMQQSEIQKGIDDKVQSDKALQEKLSYFMQVRDELTKTGTIILEMK